MSHFGEQIAPASVLRMICFNHGLMGDLMGAFYRPPCTLSNQMLHWGHTSFRGPHPLGPHVIRSRMPTCRFDAYMLVYRGVQAYVKDGADGARLVSADKPI